VEYTRKAEEFWLKRRKQMEKIRGLHTCKPQNTPKVGEIKNFVVLHMGNYTKIKSRPPDEGGAAYMIMTVAKTDYSDQHGNVSFNLEIEPVSSGGTEATVVQRTVSPPAPAAFDPAPLFRIPAQSQDDRSARIERQSARRDAVEFHRLECSNGKASPSLDRVRQLMSIMESWLNSVSAGVDE
jgi:hypothetical protein